MHATHVPGNCTHINSETPLQHVSLTRPGPLRLLGRPCTRPGPWMFDDWHVCVENKFSHSAEKAPEGRSCLRWFNSFRLLKLSGNKNYNSSSRRSKQLDLLSCMSVWAIFCCECFHDKSMGNGSHIPPYTVLKSSVARSSKQIILMVGQTRPSPSSRYPPYSTSWLSLDLSITLLTIFDRVVPHSLRHQHIWWNFMSSKQNRNCQRNPDEWLFILLAHQEESFLSVQHGIHRIHNKHIYGGHIFHRISII